MVSENLAFIRKSEYYNNYLGNRKENTPYTKTIEIKTKNGIRDLKIEQGEILSKKQGRLLLNEFFSSIITKENPGTLPIFPKRSHKEGLLSVVFTPDTV